MLSRTVSVTTAGTPEISGYDDDGQPLVQLVYELDVHAAEFDRLPRASSSWGVRPREVTEIGFEWFIVRPGWLIPAPGADSLPYGGGRQAFWNPDTSQWAGVGFRDFDPREATAPARDWEAAAQPLSVSTASGDGTARLVVPLDMIPPGRWVEIAVGTRFAIDKPKRHSDMIGFSQMQVVGAISESVAPTLSLASPFGDTLASPVTISGYAIDSDLHGSGTSGVSSVEYAIHDVGRTPQQAFDFDSRRWTDPEDAASKQVETLTPIVGPGGVVFEEDWRVQRSSTTSDEFELVVRALDGSGNVAEVHHAFVVDQVDPVVRFEAPRPRQMVTGDIVAVDGTIDDSSELSSIRMSVASNSTRLFLDANRQWVAGEVSFEPEIEEVNGLTTFRWTWAAPDDTAYYSVYVTAEDAAGNSERTHLRFGSMPSDTEGPLVQLTSPREHTVHSGTVRVRGRAHDAVELAEVRIEVWNLLDGTSQVLSRFFDEPVPVSGPGQWQYFDTTIDLGAIMTSNGPGPYAIAALAVDAVGHETRDLHPVVFEV